jgi:hypothetical protein
MVFKKIVFLFICISVLSCSEDTDITVSRNLQEYINESKNVAEKAIVAFAANAEANTSLTSIFYYPEAGATDIRYYELTDSSLDENSFVNYRRQSLNSEEVFGGKLERFSRSGSSESWCLVTYIKEDVLRVSDPIKLNNTSKTTAYSDEVTVNYKTTLEPNFTWEDGVRNESIRYFQVFTDEEGAFISGTFTEDTFFQYYDETKDNINTTMPKNLVEDEVYNFTMLGIGADNWVHIIIEEQFIPRNLEEYIAINSEKERDRLLAFAGNANGNKNTTYIYFYPVEGAFNYRYYETENVELNSADFSNYRRRSLTDTPQFGGKFRRFSNASSDEVWCLVTYIAAGKLHISDPIRTKNNTRETEWATEVDIDYSETLKPKFTWTDGTFIENETYFQVFTQSDDTFLSGTFTAEKTFQYNTDSNVILEIHTETPPSLVIDETYTLYVFGLSVDNWLNLVIQKSFTAE